MTTNLPSEFLAAGLQNAEACPRNAATGPAAQSTLLSELGSHAESFWAEINDFLALTKAGHRDDAEEALDGIRESLGNINAYIGRLIAI
jgi:septation ring formation regulator EzrA